MNKHSILPFFFVLMWATFALISTSASIYVIYLVIMALKKYTGG